MMARGDACSTGSSVCSLPLSNVSKREEDPELASEGRVRFAAKAPGGEDE
jgi:hypothetical protein